MHWQKLITTFLVYLIFSDLLLATKVYGQGFRKPPIPDMTKPYAPPPQQPSAVLSPIHNFGEVKALLRKLSDHTVQWLKCGGSSIPCISASYQDIDDPINFKKVWLYKLLEARGRYSHETMGIRTGVAIQKINADIRSLQQELDEDIRKFNATFFRRELGLGYFKRQLAYFNGPDFHNYLLTLKEEGHGYEYRAQLSLLKVMRPGFASDNQSALRLFSARMFTELYAAIEGDSHDDLHGKAEELFAELLARNHAAVDDLLAIAPETSTAERAVLVDRALLDGDLTSAEIELLRVWSLTTPKHRRVDSPANALATAFLAFFPMVRLDPLSIGSERLEFISLVKNLEFFDGIADVAGDVKWALTAFLDLQHLPSFFGVVCVFMSSVVIVAKFFLDEHHTTEDTLNIATGIAFASAYSRNIAPYARLVGIARDAGIRVWRKFSNQTALTLGNLISRTRVGDTLVSILPKFVRIFGESVGRRLSVLVKYGQKVFVGLGIKSYQPFLHYIATGQFVAHVAFMMAEAYFLYDTVTNWATKDVVRRVTGIGNSVVIMSAFTVYSLKIYLTSVSINVAGINIFLAALTMTALVIFIVDQFVPAVILDIKPREDDPSKLYYENQLHPTKSYYHWCDDRPEADAAEAGLGNCQQSYSASVPLGLNRQSQPVFLGPRFGGANGSRELRFHEDSSPRGDFDADLAPLHKELAVFRITRLAVWNCRSRTQKDLLGFDYTVEADLDLCNATGNNCASRTHRMGCARSKARGGIQERYLEANDQITAVRIYHLREGVASRRVIKLRFQFKNSSAIETAKFGSRSYHLSFEYNNLLEYPWNGEPQTGVGEFIGFHGRHGDSIDSFGVYVRGQPTAVYHPEIYTRDREWRHKIEDGLCQQMAPISKDVYNRFDNRLLRPYEGKPGGCSCTKFVSYSHNPPFENHKAVCMLP